MVDRTPNACPFRQPGGAMKRDRHARAQAVAQRENASNYDYDK
jgi:hypothetical protein